MIAGRQVELDWVLRTIAERRPVAVTGEPGIGKSAFIDLVVTALGQNVFRGSGVSGLRWHAYAPLITALRRPMPRGDGLAVASYVADRVGDGVLVLDDLHLCDPDTLSLLSLLLPRLRLLIAFGTRDFGGDAINAQCERLGAVVVHLTGLADDSATELVRRLQPRLSSERVANVVDLAGGNPRLLTALGRSDGQASAHGLAAQWLDGCSPEAQDALCMLALVGRPALLATIGEGSDELVAAGLAVRDGAGLISLMHGVVGRVAVGRLEPAQRRWRHALLAERLTDPGEIARHSKAAGAPDVAARFALEAASRTTVPGERSRHLNLAASCLPANAGALLLASAEAAAEAGDYQTVVALAEQAATADPRCRASAALWRARALLALGHADDAHRAASDQLDAGNPPPEVRTALRIEAAHAMSQLPGTEIDALRTLQVIVADTDHADHHPRLLYALGSAQAAAGGDEWKETLTAAQRAAEELDDWSLQFSIAYALAFCHLHWGDTERAKELSVRMASRARADLRLQWYVQFEILRLWYDLFVRADYPTAVSAATLLAESVLPPGAAQSAAALLAVALMDTGEFTRAEQILQRARADPQLAPGPDLRWAIAEFGWLTGNPPIAATTPEPYGAAAAPWDALLAVTSAWADWQRPGCAPPSTTPVSSRPYGGGRDEIAGISRLRNEPLAAVVLFADAVREWQPRQQRAARRAAWAHAEAQRLGGDLPGSVKSLESLRNSLQSLGFRALDGRLDRSLRAAGRRRGAGRSADSRGLTDSERNVLALVSVGLTSADIARRLQIGVATVDDHVQSATTKLGAANRKQAAAMLATSAVTRTDQDQTLPYTVITQPRLRAAIESELTGRGWRVLAGFTLHGMDFDVRDARVVCAGTVANANDRQAALIAAVRGAGLLVELSEQPIEGDDEFVADLERLSASLGALGVVRHPAGVTPDGLTDEMIALLRDLADGSTVAQAARRLHLSLRGAHRRLAMARTLLGVSTTQQAIVEIASRLGH